MKLIGAAYYARNADRSKTYVRARYSHCLSTHTHSYIYIYIYILASVKLFFLRIFYYTAAGVSAVWRL